MTVPDILRPLVGKKSGPVEAIITAPATSWRSGPAFLIKREIHRLRGLRIRDSEAVVWPATPGGSSRLPVARQLILGGSIRIKLDEDAPIRVLAREGEFKPRGPIYVGSGGGMRQTGLWANREVILRLGAVDSAGDPARHYAALEQLNLPEMPDGVATGVISGVRWSIEGLVPGETLLSTTAEQNKQVVRFLSTLPMRPEPIEVVASTLEELRDLGIDIGGVGGRLLEATATVPSVAAHGDMWAGNLLFRQGNLVGVIDWDSWHERGAPGIDLMHLWAEGIRRRNGGSYGDLVARDFWMDEGLVSMTRQYFDAVQITWTPDLHRALGTAWWVVAVSGALRRNVTLAEDPTWMHQNVTAPAEQLNSSLK